MACDRLRERTVFRPTAVNFPAKRRVLFELFGAVADLNSPARVVLEMRKPRLQSLGVGLGSLIDLRAVPVSLAETILT
jgi:hypothetical protein